MAKYFDKNGDLIEITVTYDYLRALRTLSGDLRVRLSNVGWEEPCLFLPCPYPNSLIPAVATVEDAISHLNDDHKWSFEQIADWLDSLPLKFEVK